LQDDLLEQNILVLRPEELEKSTNNFSIFGVPTEIRTRPLLNTRQKRYHLL